MRLKRCGPLLQLVWDEDEVMAAVLIGRLLHHSHLVNIRGNCFRMRQHTELWQFLHYEPDPQEETTT